MSSMKTAAFSKAPSSFWVVVSEGVSRYTRLAAVRMLMSEVVVVEERV